MAVKLVSHPTPVFRLRPPIDEELLQSTITAVGDDKNYLTDLLQVRTRARQQNVCCRFLFPKQ